MIAILEELLKRGLIQENQVPEIVKTAEERYDGNVEDALLSYNVSEDAILELKGIISNVPIKMAFGLGSHFFLEILVYKSHQSPNFLSNRCCRAPKIIVEK